MKMCCLIQYWPFQTANKAVQSKNQSVEMRKSQPIGKYDLRYSKVSKNLSKLHPTQTNNHVGYSLYKRNDLAAQHSARFMQTCALPLKSSKSEACV